MTSLLAILGLISTAHAQVPPLPPCPVIMPGCGGVTNVIATSFIPNVVLFILRVVGALAVVMVVWYGLTLVMNRGDEQNVTKGKWGIIYALLGLVLAIMAQVIVSFVTTELYVTGAGDVVVDALAQAVRIMLNVTNALFALMLVYYGGRMVISQGKTDDYSRARTGILWTVIGAMFVNIAHALVRAVTSFFGV